MIDSEAGATLAVRETTTHIIQRINYPMLDGRQNNLYLKHTTFRYCLKCHENITVFYNPHYLKIYIIRIY